MKAFIKSSLVILNSISDTLKSYIKYNKDIMRMACLIDDESRILLTEVAKFPRSLRKYAAWRAYRMAYWHYPLESIVFELKFLRGIFRKGHIGEKIKS